MRISHALAIAVCCLAGDISDVDADQTGEDAPPGAPVTTSVDGSRVDGNRYARKADVYLAGTGVLAAGDYYFAVTDPSGAQVLSSDALSCREIRISDGVIVDRGSSGCAHARGVDRDHAALGAITVQLMAFENTPSEVGEYVVRIVPVNDYDGSFVHTGAKHADFKVEPVPAPVCGNGIVETGEQCDDGNTTDGDGCSSSCTIEAQPPMCGNGTVEIGEQCDDGNTTDGDGCSSTCTVEVLPPDCDDMTDMDDASACMLEAPARSSRALAT